MNNRRKIVNLLGLAKRAGKVVTGEELVLKRVQSQQAKIVFLASDSGKNTLKKFTDKCHTYEIPLSTEFSRDELSVAIGQVRSVVCVVDNGFSKKLKQLQAGLTAMPENN